MVAFPIGLCIAFPIGLCSNVSEQLHSDEHIRWSRGWHGPLEDYFPVRIGGASATHFHVTESLFPCLRRHSDKNG